MKNIGTVGINENLKPQTRNTEPKARQSRIGDSSPDAPSFRTQQHWHSVIPDTATLALRHSGNHVFSVIIRNPESFVLKSEI